LLLCLAGAGLCATAQPSCTGYPLSGSVSFIDQESGAQTTVTIHRPERGYSAKGATVRSSK
jgi:hypothetical protein